MAHWINNDPQPKQRKRWEIEDKKLLQNLKFQLANDGSKDVQFDLGKQLLEDTDEPDLEARQEQGIQYVKKAAEQGHELALELLGACFRTGRGITDCNEGEIRKFLSMTPGERSARRAAQELFASLSNGEEYVTVEQLERKMREIYKLQKKKKKPDEHKDQQLENGDLSVNNRIEHNGDGGKDSKSTSPARCTTREHIMNESNHISEANLLSAAYNYSNGQMPGLNQALTLSIPNSNSLNHVPCLHRPFFHPSMFFSLLYYRFISIFASFPMEFIARFQVILILVAYAIISTENLFGILPTAGYFVSLAVMVIASFKMLKTKHEFIDFRIWSGLFLSYDEHVAADDSESRFLRNNLKPYFWFFLSFFANLMIYPFIADQWLPHSEITVVSFGLTFITMICFMYTSSPQMPDFLVLFSFGLNVLAKYPYEMDSVVTNKWRFLDLKIPGFSTYVIGNGIEFSMNCRGMLYLAIPIFMFFLAKRRNWQGVFQFLIPHCITLSWLQIAIVSTKSATTFGLMRSALGLAGILLFLPLFGLVTLLIPVFAAVEWLSLTDSTNRIFVTISTSIIAITGSCFMAISNRTGRYVTFVQILLCFLASCFLFRPYMVADQDQMYSSYLQESSTESKVTEREGIMDVLEEAGSLNWDMYHKYCQSPAWSHTNRINTQIRCSHLDGADIHWDGVVLDVGIKNARNWRKDIIQNYLPLFMSNPILCYFGDINRADCFNGESCDIKDFIDGHKKCNVDKWNVYEYEIEVKMTSSASKGILNLNPRQESKVVIKADHIFGNFTQRINASDKVWFKGILRSSLASKTDDLSMNHRDNNQDSYKNRKHTIVELTSIGCLHCTDKKLAPISNKGNLKTENRLKDLRRALIYLLNVLFNPLVTFK